MVAPMNTTRPAVASAGGALARMAASTRPARGWFTARSVAKAVAGEVVQGGATGNGVSTDSRRDCAGQVFVALRGDNHDGHRYLDQALAQGAVGLVVDREFDLEPLLRARRLGSGRQPFVVRVADTGKALLDLAAEHRRRHRAKIVGITGSCGKT